MRALINKVLTKDGTAINVTITGPARERQAEHLHDLLAKAGYHVAVEHDGGTYGTDQKRPSQLVSIDARERLTTAPGEDAVERVARIIAAELGDDYDHAFANKTDWIDARGQAGGRFRDVNEPYRSDYLDAARATFAAMPPPLTQAERVNLATVIAYAAGVREGLERAAKVADGAAVQDTIHQQHYLTSARNADSTSGREVDLEYAVSYARRASGDRAIAAAIRNLATTRPEKDGDTGESR